MEPWKNLIKSGIASRGNKQNKGGIQSRINERNSCRKYATRMKREGEWRMANGEWRKAHIDKQGIQAQNEKK